VDADQLVSSVTACADDVTSCMQSNRLKPETGEAERFGYRANRRRHQLSFIPTRIGNDLVAYKPSSICDLGSYGNIDESNRLGLDLLQQSSTEGALQVIMVRPGAIKLSFRGSGSRVPTCVTYNCFITKSRGGQITDHIVISLPITRYYSRCN
jgi:hypothetical protein